MCTLSSERRTLSAILRTVIKQVDSQLLEIAQNAIELPSIRKSKLNKRVEVCYKSGLCYEGDKTLFPFKDYY